MSNSYLTITPDVSEFTLPYGRHSGKHLSEVPRPYLHWAYNECDFKYFPEFQRAIEQYLGLQPDPAIRVGNRNKIGNRDGGAKVVGASRTSQVYLRDDGTHAPGGGTQSPRNGLESGLDGFRRAFERARREALLEFEAEPEIRDLLEETLGKVRNALGI